MQTHIPIRHRLAVSLLLVMLLSLLCVLPVRAQETDLYSRENINEYSTYFTNYVDGYRLMIPRDMRVDMSHSEVRTVLSNASCTIEIYDQPLTADSANSYTAYSNRFIENTALYTVLSDYTDHFAGCTAHVLEWQRAPLRRVQGDRCYYASVDVEVDTERILTFLFKSNTSFNQGENKYYTLVLNTLKLLEPTKEPENVPTTIQKHTSWNAATKAYYEKYFGENSQLSWGVYMPGAPENWTDGLMTLEEQLDHEFAHLLFYSSIGYGLDNVADAMANAKAHNRTLELTLQPSLKAPENGDNVLLQVLNGQFDDYLRDYAKLVADYNDPILFRLCNEFNGDWCLYSAWHTSKDTNIFVEFYRYVYEIFRENGALRNTIWVWNPNGRSFPNYLWNHAVCYYPGDEYVDIIGVTGYNTGTYYASSGERWRSFREIYDAFYDEYDRYYAQPFMITEFACSGIGGDKPAWVRQMLKDIADYPRIRLAVWWSACDYDNGQPSRTYFMNDSSELIRIFKQYFSQEGYLTRGGQPHGPGRAVWDN